MPLALAWSSIRPPYYCRLLAREILINEDEGWCTQERECRVCEVNVLQCVLSIWGKIISPTPNPTSTPTPTVEFANLVSQIEFEFVEFVNLARLTA